MHDSITVIINQIRQSEQRLESEYEKLKLLNADDELRREHIMEHRISVLHQLFKFRNEVIDGIK